MVFLVMEESENGNGVSVFGGLFVGCLCGVCEDDGCFVIVVSLLEW